MSDTKTDFIPNLEKLKQLQKQQESIIIGGKGVPRRKKKVVHKTAVTDEKKLQNSLKKLTVNNIQGIEEVNMFKDSGEVLHFANPKVQASLTSNIFAINGHPETKQLTELLPGIMNQLGAENVFNLRNLANTLSKVAEETKNQNAAAQSATGTNDDDDVPELVENFDEASSKPEATTPAAPAAAATEETK